MKSFIVVLILLCCIVAIVQSRSHYSFCTKDFVQRYCALKNGTAALECVAELGKIRAIEIFEGCFTSMYSGEMSLLEKAEKACERDTLKNEMLRRCSVIGVILQDEKDGETLKIIEECLTKVEKIENKPCYRPEVMFRNPFGYPRRYH